MYKRILLKLSGETLLGKQSFGVDFNAAKEIALLLHTLQKKGLQIGIVIGAGNIFRGLTETNFGWDRTTADSIGMLSTVINCLSLGDALKEVNCPSHVLSMLHCGTIVDPFSVQHARNLLDKGNVTVFSGGTGNPYFTTDSAAALKACEINADILIKATKVDGVYDQDPKVYPNAKKYKSLTYTEVLKNDLKIMDATAVAMCRDNKLPIRILNFFSPTFIEDLSSSTAGTLIHGD